MVSLFFTKKRFCDWLYLNRLKNLKKGMKNTSYCSQFAAPAYSSAAPASANEPASIAVPSIFTGQVTTVIRTEHGQVDFDMWPIVALLLYQKLFLFDGKILETLLQLVTKDYFWSQYIH